MLCFINAVGQCFGRIMKIALFLKQSANMANIVQEFRSKVKKSCTKIKVL